MNNATKFKELFGVYATELWSKSENEFLDWLNKEYDEQIEPSIETEKIISVVKEYISDINLAEIASHIERNDLSEWIDRWRFAFEVDILKSNGDI